MATMLAYPRHGILLNPSPSSFSQSLPFPAESAPVYTYGPSSSSTRSSTSNNTNNNLYLSASSSSHRSRSTSPGGGAPPSSSSSAANSPRSQARKIRFAPLPDPRRSVCVTDDGEELPFLPGASSTDGSDDSINGVWATLPDGRVSPKSESPEALDTPLAQGAWSTPSTTPSTSPYPGTTPLSPSSYNDYTPTQPPASPFMSKTKKLFKPLLPTKALSDLKLNVSTEDVLTLGTINLFRTSSRDSNTGGRGSRASSRERATQSDDETIGAALARSSSSGSARKRRSVVSVPFRRTQSYDVVQKAAPARTAPASNGMQGQRMLNGRVYGARRQQNPFANIPDKEPEFVEWGYGGMGAVKTAKEAGSMLWAPVHGKVAVATGGGGDDDDDGSGAAWIKKRREARAAKEQAKKEAEAAATTPDADATPVPPPAPTPETSLATIIESTSAVTTPKGESAPTSMHHTGESSEYMHTTLCLPAAPSLARHHRSRSGLSTVSEGVAAREGVVGDLELDGAAGKAASEQSNSPADSVDDVSATEEDVDAEEAEELAAEEARRTAKGASVEVLSKRKRVA